MFNNPPSGRSLESETVVLDEFSHRANWHAGDQLSGGARRDRTDDLMLAKHALSQLSYGPERETSRTSKGFDLRAIKAIQSPIWWAWEDLNFRPHAYQARALTN